MKKIILLLIVVGFAAISFATNIFAATTRNVNVSGTAVTLVGEAGAAVPNSTINVFIYKPDYVLPSAGDGEGDITAFMHHVGEIAVGSDGSFTYNFNFRESDPPNELTDSISGYYTAVYSDSDESVSFLYMSLGDREQIRLTIADENDKSALNVYLTEESKIDQKKSVGIFIDEYLALTDDEQREAVCQKVIDEENTGENVDVVGILNKHIVYQLLNNADGKSAKKAVIDKYNDIFSIDFEDSYYKKYPTETMELFALNSEITPETIQDVFNDSVFLANINSVDWGYIIPTMQAFSDKTAEADFTGYNNLAVSKQTLLCMDMQDTNFTAVSQITVKFNELVTSYTKQTDTTSTSSNSGKSSGGSSGSSSTPFIVQSTYLPELDEDEKLPFDDLAGYEWGADSVVALYKKNIISKADKFRPADNITREEFVKMLVKAFEITGNGEAADFSDIESSHWAYEYVAAAKACGITHGMGDGSFGIGAAITRQEAAVFLNRVIEYTGKNLAGNIEKSFSDSETVADWAEESVTNMVELGIINGFEDNTFRPTQSCTRIQVAILINSLLKLY